MAYKPFKMKASGRGNNPMKKNFPSAFKIDGKGTKTAKSPDGKTKTSKGTKISKDEFAGIGSTERELRDYFDKKFPKSIDPDGTKKHEAMKRYFKNKNK